MMNDLSALLPYINVILTIAIAFGSILAVRKSYVKVTGEIQARIIAAQQEETQQLRTKIGDCEKEIARLSLIIETIQEALRTKGIYITIDGEIITIADERNGGSTITSKLVPGVSVGGASTNTRLRKRRTNGERYSSGPQNTTPPSSAHNS